MSLIQSLLRLGGQPGQRVLPFGGVAIALLLLCFACQPAPLHAAPALFACADVSEIPQNECGALVTLYNTTNGPSWVNQTDWLVTNTPCRWFGVTCTSGHVTVVSLTYNGLTGNIPLELGQLSQLKRLVLYNNNLSGTIPVELGNLANLTELSLAANQLTGSIPAALGNLNQLTIFGLSGNQLTGVLPTTLANFTNVTGFGVDGNQLEGDIPTWLGALTHLQQLRLGFNRFTGVFPSELCNLGELQQLTLGGIPTETKSNLDLAPLITCLSDLNNYLQLSDLQVVWTTLNGSIPPAIIQRTALKVLHLGGNQLSGSIPPELGNLTNLEELSLNQNALDGSLPVQLGNLTKLRLLYLFINNLTGAIPAELGNLTNLVDLQLHRNNLSGVVPNTLCNLTKLGTLEIGGKQGAAVNFDVAPLLACINALPQLTRLGITYTQLTGAIPAPILNLTQVKQLWLSGNRLHGPIPELQQLTQLEELYLAENQFTDAIPTKLGSLPQLRILLLNGNQLSSHIPAELGNLTKLQYLYLDNNALAGEIPVELTQLGKNPGTSFIRLTVDANLLTAANPTVRAFLAQYNPTWEATQTVPPTNLQVQATGSTTATLTWTPIAYATGPGGYEAGVNTQPGAPYTVMTQTTDKLAASTMVTNLCPETTYNLAIRTHTAPHGVQQNDLHSAYSGSVQITTAKRTVQLLSLYVLALDSNLDKEYDALVQGIAESTIANSDEFAVVLADRNGDADTHILVIECGKIIQLQGLPDPITYQLDPNRHEYDMTDPAALAAFIRWARTTYGQPVAAAGLTVAAKTTLSYIGHGVPLAPATDITPYVKPRVNAAGVNDTFPVPGGQEIHPDQITDQHPLALISPYALAEALRQATDNGTNPLTVLDIVHCFGGTIEELYELSNPGGKPLAEVMIGSPNYTYSGPALLSRALSAVHPTQSAPEMAKAIVASYEAALADADKIDGHGDPTHVGHPRIIIAVDSSQVPAIKTAVDALARALVPQPGQMTTVVREGIDKAQATSRHYDTTTCDLPNRPQDWQLTAEDGLSDLADFAAQLQVHLPAVTVTATQVSNAITGATIALTRASGKPWFIENAPADWIFDERNKGIALYTDFQGMKLNDQTYIGWQTRWYTSTVSDLNLYPYAFVQPIPTQPDSTITWANVMLDYWSGRVVENGVQTIACATKLPAVRSRQLYLPFIAR